MLELPDQKKLEEGNKDKSKCVTIYTWPASENSSERARGILGHSALKTYSGGSSGKGVYVSFYPGDCDIGCDLFLMSSNNVSTFKLSEKNKLYLYRDNEGFFYCIENNQKKKYLPEKLVPKSLKHASFDQPAKNPAKCANKEIYTAVLEITHEKDHTRDKNPRRVASCVKSVSHFHRWNQEMSKETIEKAISIDLFGLNIDLINQAFQELHDSDMNSHRLWSSRYNCSDVVLFLLEKGGIFDKINPSRYGWKTISIIGVLNGILAPRIFQFWFIRAIPYIFSGGMKKIDQKIYYKTDFSKWYPVNHPNQLAKSIIDFAFLFITFTGGAFSIIMTYLYSLASYSKTSLPLKYYNTSCLIDAMKAGIFGVIITTLEPIAIRNTPVIRKLIFYVNETIEGYIDNNLTSWFAHTILKSMDEHKDVHWYKYPAKFSAVFLFILCPFLFVSFSLMPKYFFDTTTTPNHVLNVVQSTEAILKNPDEPKKNNRKIVQKNEFIQEKKPSLIDKIYDHKYKLCAGALLAASGFFAMRYASNSKTIIQGLLENVTPKSFGCTLF